MKYTQNNGKIKLCETDNMDHLVRLTQALNENNILYETRLKKGTFINNPFFPEFFIILLHRELIIRMKQHVFMY